MTLVSNQKPVGRLRVAQSLSTVSAFSLSVGSKETRIANINVDFDKQWHPDICADVAHLPFRESLFDLVYFTDVIEHLPKGLEPSALEEIYRVTSAGGNLILSTPHDVSIYTRLDPAFWVIGHRHYSQAIIRKLVEESGFYISKLFVRGGAWDVVSIITYSAFCVPFKRLAHVNAQLPSWFNKKVDVGYNYGSPGYTIFVVATKMQR